MINDYSTLQAAIADELARADISTAIPQFIQLAESRFNRELRLSPMQAQVTGTITDGILELPADCREIQSFRLSIGGRWLNLPVMPPESLQDQLHTGYPMGYVVVNGNAVLVGTNGDVDYSLTYFQAIPSLSDASPQNWLILREPGLYLYAALGETAPYLREDERLVTWGTMYKSIKDGMEAEDARYRYGNAPAMQSGLRCAP